MDSEVKFKTCAHQGCACEPRNGSRYCSSYCEEWKDKVEETCGCGHDDCGAIGVLSDAGLLLTPELA